MKQRNRSVGEETVLEQTRNAGREDTMVDGSSVKLTASGEIENEESLGKRKERKWLEDWWSSGFVVVGDGILLDGFRSFAACWAEPIGMIHWRHRRCV